MPKIVIYYLMKPQPPKPHRRIKMISAQEAREIAKVVTLRMEQEKIEKEKKLKEKAFKTATEKNNTLHRRIH
jgi:hypothetical protein